MKIAEEFASRLETLITDPNDHAYDDGAVIRFEEDIYAVAHRIPVDPEDENCVDYLYVFEDGSAIDGSEGMKVATPDTIKELQELQSQWEEFEFNWFIEHPNRERRSVFDRKECAEEFRNKVLQVLAEDGPGSEEITN